MNNNVYIHENEITINNPHNRFDYNNQKCQLNKDENEIGTWYYKQRKKYNLNSFARHTVRIVHQPRSSVSHFDDGHKSL